MPCGRRKKGLYDVRSYEDLEDLYNIGLYKVRKREKSGAYQILLPILSCDMIENIEKVIKIKGKGS